MKRKSCLTLALILVMVQLISLFAVVPATAATPVKTYDVKKSNVAPTVDGTVDAIWGSVEPTANFAFKKAQNKYVESTSLVATAKLLYVDNGDLIDVYVLIQTRNTETWSAVNRATIVINNIAIHINWSSGATSHNFSVSGTDERTYNYTGARKQATSGGADYEYRFQLTAEEAQSIDFDMYVLDGGGNRGVYTGNDQGSYSCADTTAWNATVSSKAALNFVDETKDVISIESTDGASIRVDTDVWNQSGIRFATKVDTARLADLKADGATVTTGTLIVPTNSLAAVDNVFTFEALAEMTEGTHYYNLVNENNEWVEGEVAGTWYGTLYNIRDFGRSFSAVGYVTVTYNGTTTTLYGDVCSRTIAGVAQAALALGGWSDEQVAVLNYFINGNAEA